MSQSPQFEEFFVAPHGRVQTLFRLNETDIVPIARLDLWPIAAKVCVSQQWLACIVPDRRVVTAHFSRTGRLSDFEIVPLPQGVELSSILLYENLLFAGGSNNGLYLAVVDLDSATREWISIPCMYLESGEQSEGKGIDAIASHWQNLYAFDNIMWPIYVLEFRKHEEGILFSRRMRLKTHTTYEHIVFAVANHRYLATLSQGVGGEGHSQHISIQLADDGRETYCLGLFTERHTNTTRVYVEYSEDQDDEDGNTELLKEEGVEVPDGAKWKDLAITGDRLLIAGGTLGLGMFYFGGPGLPTYIDGPGPVERVFAFQNVADYVAITTRHDQEWQTCMHYMPK